VSRVYEDELGRSRSRILGGFIAGVSGILVAHYSWKKEKNG
jgi:hypothetical protein